MFGFLCLDKPLRKTSRDAVDQVQRKVKPAKVGHAGTLDPLATGVLVAAVGGATRLIDWVQQQPKTYEAVFRFGVKSDTDDLEGELISIPGPRPTRAAIEKALPNFLGWISQVPPIYSAIKVEGRRAYDLARKGREVELQARPVRIDSLTILEYDDQDLRLRIQCGAGTYIRSLGRDLARALQSEAVMVELRRTAIGGFHVEEGLEWAQLRDATRSDLERRLLSPAQALPSLDIVELHAAGLQQLRLGRAVPLEQTPLLRTAARPDESIAPASSDASTSIRYALGHDHRGKLAALLQETPAGWKVEKAFWDDPDFRAESPETIVIGDVSLTESQPAATTLQAERSRWAEELHDGLVQELVGAKMLLEGVISTGADRVEIVPRLSRVAVVLDHALREARELVAELHNRPDLAIASIDRWLHDDEERRAAYPDVNQFFSIAVKLADPQATRQIGRVIQEGARNALRHASASNLSISLEALASDDASQENRKPLRLTIVDDGSGFDPSLVPADRFGLKMIRSRVDRTRGSVSWTSIPSGGTRLQVDWPEGVLESKELETPIVRGRHRD